MATIGQKRAVAHKLAAEFQEHRNAEMDNYLNSKKFEEDLQDFKNNSNLYTRMAEAYQLINSLPLYIDSLDFIKKPGKTKNSYYQRRMDIKRVDDIKHTIDELVEKDFIDELTYNFTYPSSYDKEEIYNLVEYMSIAGMSLVEIEDKIREQIKSNFSVSYVYLD